MSAVGWVPAVTTKTPGFSVVTVGPKAHADVRISNMSLLLRRVQAGPPLSRTDLVRETGLSKASVSTLVAELCARGLVVEDSPDLSGAVGRPSMALRVAADAVAGIGVEIGGDCVAATVVNLAGTVIHQSSCQITDPQRSFSAVIDEVGVLLAQQIRRAAEASASVPEIVIAQTGALDYATGVVRFSSSLGWHDVPLREQMRETLSRLLPEDVPVPSITVENDAKLAALAVYRDYAAQGVEHLLYLSGGDGIGAGIIADGHLLRGWYGSTGEVGHMPVDPDGDMCPCGRRGCWETLIGLRAMTQMYPPDDPIHRKGASVDERMQMLRQRFDAGDPIARARLARAQSDVARGLEILVDVLNPHVIVVSGWLALFADVLLAPAGVALEKRSLDRRPTARVEASTLGTWAASTGAALVALEPILRDPTLLECQD